jgi:hypothetical protein
MTDPIFSPPGIDRDVYARWLASQQGGPAAGGGEPLYLPNDTVSDLSSWMTNISKGSDLGTDLDYLIQNNLLDYGAYDPVTTYEHGVAPGLRRLQQMRQGNPYQVALASAMDNTGNDAIAAFNIIQRAIANPQDEDQASLINYIPKRYDQDTGAITDIPDMSAVQSQLADIEKSVLSDPMGEMIDGQFMTSSTQDSPATQALFKAGYVNRPGEPYDPWTLAPAGVTRETEQAIRDNVDRSRGELYGVDNPLAGTFGGDRLGGALPEMLRALRGLNNSWGPAAPKYTAPALRGLDEDAAKKAALQAEITGIDLNLPSWVSMPDWLDGSGMSIDTDPNNPLTGPRHEQQAQQIEEAFAARRERQEAGTAGRNEGNWQQDISNLRDDLETDNSGGNWWQDIKDLKFWGNDKEEGTGPGGTPVRASSADIENRRRNRTSSGDIPLVPGMDPRDAPNGKINDGETQSPPSRLPGPGDGAYRDESGNIRIGVDTSGHGASTPNQVAAIPQGVRRAIENTYFDEYGKWASYEDMSKSMRFEMDRLAREAGTMPGESLDKVIARLTGAQTSQRGKGSIEDQYGGSQRPGPNASPTPWTLQPGVPPGPSSQPRPSGPSGPYGPSSQPGTPSRGSTISRIVDNKAQEQALLGSILNQRPSPAADRASNPIQDAIRKAAQRANGERFVRADRAAGKAEQDYISAATSLNDSAGGIRQREALSRAMMAAGFSPFDDERRGRNQSVYGR